MKTDTYTKIILTIIAIALTANLLKGMITPAVAEGKHYATVPLNNDGSINVRIAPNPAPMEVTIKDVDAYAFRNVTPIPVKTN
jgi:hypothetical protein